MLTKEYLMRSLGFRKARGVYSDGKTSGDGGVWIPKSKPKPKPEKPDFIKEGEFKV